MVRAPQPCCLPCQDSKDIPHIYAETAIHLAELQKAPSVRQAPLLVPSLQIRAPLLVPSLQIRAQSPGSPCSAAGHPWEGEGAEEAAVNGPASKRARLLPAPASWTLLERVAAAPTK